MRDPGWFGGRLCSDGIVGGTRSMSFRIVPLTGTTGVVCCLSCVKLASNGTPGRVCILVWFSGSLVWILRVVVSDADGLDGSVIRPVAREGGGCV